MISFLGHHDLLLEKVFIHSFQVFRKYILPRIFLLLLLFGLRFFGLEFLRLLFGVDVPLL
jgi:hypothetical protein